MLVDTDFLIRLPQIRSHILTFLCAREFRQSIRVSSTALWHESSFLLKSLIEVLFFCHINCCSAEAATDPECRVRLRPDSAFSFRIRSRRYLWKTGLGVNFHFRQ